MDHAGGVWAPRQVLRNLLVLCFWAIWLPITGARALARLVHEFLDTHIAGRRKALWLIPGGLGLVVLIQMGPLVYGRFALINEARHQARTSFNREPQQLEWALRLSAFRHGFKDVIHQEEAFSIESGTDDDGGALCVINIQLEQNLKLLGCLPMVFHVRQRVSAPITAVDFRKKREDDHILVE